MWVALFHKLALDCKWNEDVGQAYIIINVTNTSADNVLTCWVDAVDVGTGGASNSLCCVQCIRVDLSRSQRWLEALCLWRGNTIERVVERHTRCSIRPYERHRCSVKGDSIASTIDVWRCSTYTYIIIYSLLRSAARLPLTKWRYAICNHLQFTSNWSVVMLQQRTPTAAVG